MGMYELAHNSCYTKERLARYRDFDRDIDARDFARELMVSFGLWKSCELYGADADNELVVDDIFDETMIENLMYEPTTVIGLIALFYRNLWAMADLHSKLKRYEDPEEQGRLIELPCDRVYRIINWDSPKYAFVDSIPIEMMPIYDLKNIDNGKWLFSTKEKAEAKLKELKKGGTNEIV